MMHMINLEATLFCGQTFAWKKHGPLYRAVIQDRFIQFEEAEFPELMANDAFLFHYFDMDWEYTKAESTLCTRDEHLKTCIERYRSIHILNQDPWEVLVGFLLSQNNNIKRIRQLYERLSVQYGRSSEAGFFSLPRPEALERVDETALRSLGLGFRAPYLLDAIQQHRILWTLPALPYEQALSALMQIKGVGPKVAACILLFGYHRMEAFPMDTWMQKVMQDRYPGKDGSYFAPYAGLAQQYLFHAERNQGGQV